MSTPVSPLAAYSAFPTFRGDMKQRFDQMKNRNARRDQRMELMKKVREGEMKSMFPAELDLNLTFEGVPIANFIDYVAHDVSELLAPLPSVKCASGKMKSDADLKRAETKNRIADGYWLKSKLQKQMFTGADRYISYGFLPITVEPDTTGKRPFIQVEDPRHSYYELDRFGQVVVYAKMWRKSLGWLCAQYPEYAAIIRGGDRGNFKNGEHEDTEIEFIKWIDRGRVVLFLPERAGLVLDSYEHKLGRAPVYIIERSGLGDKPRGQFDDVIWVQVARAIMTTLTLEAAAEAVQAPIVLPSDVDELPIGPHSVYQSDHPEGARRLNLELPPGVFQENATLQQELQDGSRYPNARSGNSTASVITGKGVESLMGSFTTQIAAAQAMMKDGLENITSICFEMDEKWWPHEQKTLNGTITGHSYEIQYTPSDDINGKYECTVTYGFAAGMQPAQSTITMLQLQGAGLLSKSSVQQNIVFDIDHEAEQKQVDVEATREALKQGLFGMMQAIPQMVSQGQDPTPLVQLVSQITTERQGGKSMETAALDAFNAYTQAQQQAAQQAAQAQQDAQAAAAGGPGGDPNAPPGAGGPPGADGGGGGADLQPPGVAPGQEGLPAGGRPTIDNLIAGFRGQGSSPVMQATIQRKTATGT